MGAGDRKKQMFQVGDRVFFWTGRGSQGYGTIRDIRDDRAFIDPEPDAIRGSDFRVSPSGTVGRERWAPRDYGVRLNHLNTPPRPWFENS
ncbi:hypothetical protein [Sphingobium sp.]|uniref:hypothetical protein n=1 Tax=Sphingobium sp. TaxID=1912891 RepID=UPI00257E5F8D|nr:hypothetical protein [Sphingobium sp.]MBR2266747.1 hypothetical protein [Sphingobium sp.]